MTKPPRGTPPRVGPGVEAGVTEAMIHEQVHTFYGQVRRDPALGPIFNRIIDDWDTHLDKMCDFWSSVLMRTGRYHGRPMPKHLALPKLNDAHFQRWLSLFRATVRDLCPPAVADLFLDRAFNIAQAFRLQLAIRDGRNALGVEPFTEADLTPAA